VGGGGVQYVLSMRAAFQWFCYDNGLLLSALNHRRKQQTRVNERIQCSSTPTMFHMMRHNQMRAAAAQRARGSGGEGVDVGMHTELQCCCRAGCAAPRIQPPSGSIYLLVDAGRDFMASCHKR
jgi:hypothetical protein